jgi:hypothetical protein
MEHAWEHGHARTLENLGRVSHELFQVIPHVKIVSDVVIGKSGFDQLWLIPWTA